MNTGIHRRARTLVHLPVVLLLVGGGAAPLAAQAPGAGLRLGGFVGRGSGPVSAFVGGLEGGYAVGRHLEILGELSSWSDWGVDCIPESHACDIGGTATLAGVSARAPLEGSAVVRLFASAGRYDPSYGSSAPAAGFGVALDLWLGGHLALAPGGRWLGVFGSDYEDATGEALRFTMFTLGLRLAF